MSTDYPAQLFMFITLSYYRNRQVFIVTGCVYTCLEYFCSLYNHRQEEHSKNEYLCQGRTFT